MLLFIGWLVTWVLTWLWLLSELYDLKPEWWFGFSGVV